MAMIHCDSCGHSTFHQERCSGCSAKICHHCAMMGKLCKECYLTQSSGTATSVLVGILMFLFLMPVAFAGFTLENSDDFIVRGDGKLQTYCPDNVCSMDFSIYKASSSDIHNFTIELQDNQSNTLDQNDYLHTIHLYHNYNLTLGNGTFEQRHEYITFAQLEDVVKNQASGQTNYFTLNFRLLPGAEFDLIPTYDRAYSEYAWFLPFDTGAGSPLEFYYDFTNGAPYSAPQDVPNLGYNTNFNFTINQTNTSAFSNGTDPDLPPGLFINNTLDYMRFRFDDISDTRIGPEAGSDMHADLGMNWSFNFWIRADIADYSSSDFRNILRFEQGSRLLQMRVDPNNSIRMIVRDSAGSEENIFIEPDLFNDSWRNVHFALDTSNPNNYDIYYYEDGVLDTTQTQTYNGELWPNNCLISGAVCGFGTRKGATIQGQFDIDEIRFYSQNLNVSEVFDIYNLSNQNITIPPSNETNMTDNVTQNGTGVVVNIDLTGVENRMSIWLIAALLSLILFYAITQRDYLIGVVGALGGMFVPFMMIETLGNIGDIEVVSILIGVVSVIFLWRFYPLISKDRNED